MPLNTTALESALADALDKAATTDNTLEVAAALAKALEAYVRSGTVTVGPAFLEGDPVSALGEPVIIPEASLTGKVN